MKQFFLTLIAMMAATMSYAQNNLVAVLSHDSEVRMFYGSSALINAVDAAVSGDVITLSGGTFGWAKITKGITIRGAGADTENPTVIGQSNKEYNIDIPSEDNNRFVLEGVRIYLSVNGSSSLKIVSGNHSFLKCKLDSEVFFDYSSTADSKFVDCSIIRFSLNGSSKVKLSNCKLTSFTNASSSTSKAEFFNCYLADNNQSSYYRSSFVNCVLRSDIRYYSGSLAADVTAMNCVLINVSDGTQIDCYKATVPEFFADYETIKDQYGTEFYRPTTDELSEEAKTKYLGTDGKVVGPEGGQYPFDLTPTYPLITKLNVAKQATADNKLSVEIEVSANE